LADYWIVEADKRRLGKLTLMHASDRLVFQSFPEYKRRPFPGQGSPLSSPGRVTRVWTGEIKLGDAVHQRLITLQGPPPLTKAFAGWLKLSVFAQQERRAG
jgi:hypothetical protein